MTGSLFLGWRYLAHHKFKSGILIASVSLMLFLPAATRLLVEDSAQALTARAQETPLILGSSGSELELVLSTLYFHAETPAPMTHGDVTGADGQDLAAFIPIYARFHSQGTPIVGTSLDYFDFRSLVIGQGRQMGMLGECVIGSRVAASTGLKAGDFLISSPETVFDLAGVYPLKMKIAGVLAPASSPDDDAIFVDLRTAWIIEGLGHGHTNLAQSDDGVLSRKEGLITANASVNQYPEITPENVASFHFHGSTDSYPVTAAIVAARNQKNAAILRGRYAGSKSGLQLTVPVRVIESLLETIFTVQNYVVLGLIVLSLATVSVVTLVFLLSQQLRKGEFHTLSKIGASRTYLAALMASEIVFVFVLSFVVATILTLVLRQFAAQILQLFLFA